MDRDGYLALHTQARRLCRHAHEAEDLVQETLLAALQAGRSDAAWLAGVMQRQAALAARTAVRRRQREAVPSTDPQTQPELASPSPHAAARTLLGALPPAARRVALLALHGLDADEIRWILALTPAAFRQRLTSIRKRLSGLDPASRAEALALAYLRDPARAVDLQFGLVRRALKVALRGQPGLATHDADGHLLVIRADAHTSSCRGNG